jgi:hypothetical protein
MRQGSKTGLAMGGPGRFVPSGPGVTDHQIPIDTIMFASRFASVSNSGFSGSR